MSDQKMKNGKLIHFPRLKERLIDKGLQALNEKKFVEALSLLRQAEELLANSPEIELGIVICLVELGELEEAKERCKRMLLEAKGDYYQVLQIYLLILIQLHEYEEMQITIEAVLEENRVPAQYAENLYKMLEFSRSMNEKHGKKTLEDERLLECEEILINGNRIEKQHELIQTLKNRNIKKYIPILQEFLKLPEKHPVMKTSILQILMEQDTDQKVIVEKFGRTAIVNPVELSREIDKMKGTEVLSLIEDMIANDNPTLYKLLKDLWLRHLYVLFPFSPEPENPNQWAAALHAIGLEMFGLEIDWKKVKELYNVIEYDLGSLCAKIKEIEEISYIEKS
jgi:tetratricopeptide (TPR) repeat protein